MQLRTGHIIGVSLSSALLLISVGSKSIAQSNQPENTLFGIKLITSTYRDVLKKFGPPQEIQAGGPFLPDEGAPVGQAAAGGAPGSGGGFGGSGGAPGGAAGGGGKSTSKNGFPGKGGSSAAAPGGSGGGPGSGGNKGGGLPGFPGSGGGSGSGGFPGSGGGPGSGGFPGSGGGLPGGDSGGGAPADDAEKPELEATWWYHDVKAGLHKSFLFNKDGKVIQIQEYGYDKYNKGSKTRRGVGLKSQLAQIIRSYGWSNDSAHDGPNMIMRFGGRDKVAFQLVKNVVVGVTVAATR